MNKKRGIILSVAVIVVALVIKAVIVNVNAEAPYSLKTYSAGEWAPIEEDFVTEKEENSLGYSVKVRSSTAMTLDAFQKEYGTLPGEAIDMQGSSFNQLLILEVDIKNDNNRDGQVYFAGWRLFDSSFTIDCYPYEEGLKFTEPAFGESPSPFVSVGVGKEYTLKLPYIIQDKHKESFKKGRTSNLIITNYPTRKIIESPIT